MDVLLVTPPSRLQVYQGLASDLAAIEPPVWSGLIAQFLLLRRCEVAMLDAEAEGLTHEQTATRIAEADARLTVFVVYGQQPSASTQCMPGARKVADALTRLGFDGATLVLGTHASALPERTLREEPYTYVCAGEGPHTILALLEHLKGRGALAAVPGLWYRDGDALRGNTSAPVIADLDAELPRQAWELLDMSRYRAHNWHCFHDLGSRGSYASLQTSLGCPFRCGFCCINAPFGGSGLRVWSPDTIIGQIDLLVERYGIRNIKIPDEMFVLNPRRIKDICDRLIERNYGLNIWAYARVDTLNDPVMVAKLGRAGFNWLGIGVESASDHVRDGVTKGRFGNADIVETIARVRDTGINIGANYIFGLPDDTLGTMRQTLDLALSLNTEWANFYCAMAYPGSPLYQVARAKGWALPDDPGGPGWIGYSQHSYDCLPLPTETLSAIQVLDFRDAAFNEYFANPDYLRLVERKFGPAVMAHVREMTASTLSRRHHDRKSA
ncbi:B12-binding domain-containing radical SAM protein [Paramagnetospirillum kuznetsovii]|uniref:B12-binding domain-containing radical SAM protein n=1 Tax=Paramagnetospirillum kuznetsovii TaxID=2053833 RepID=A0A364NV54_9PROT|nr:radical SAM protein [Paramagnetospirillum kuznetsovii]RAU20880.1 B12-binding domain-containing radical SAM protein [Paramagnetospirillum kuznetsovii]